MPASTAHNPPPARPAAENARLPATHPGRVQLHARRALRLTVPQELTDLLAAGNGRCMLAKERTAV